MARLHHPSDSRTLFGAKDRIAWPAAALALLAFAAPVDGQVNPVVDAPALVDFEDVPGVPVNDDIDTGDFTSGGFVFDVSNDHANFAHGELYFLGDPIAYNGSTVFFLHGWYDGGWVHPSVTLTPLSGGTFALHQMDLSESGFFSDAWTLGITGTYAAGGEISTVHVFDGVLDGIGPLEDYQTATFDESWSGLQSLTLMALTGYKQAEWTVDDMVVTFEGHGALVERDDDGGQATAPVGPASPDALGGGAGPGSGPTQGTAGPGSSSSGTTQTDHWSDLGGALAGRGAPTLAGRGTPAPGQSVVLRLTGARPDADVVLVAGFSYLGAPFAGGLLGPAPDLALAPLSTAADGTLVLRDTWPATVPPLRLWFQTWIADPAAPAGLAASNTLMLQP